jgi:hypothetical protein
MSWLVDNANALYVLSAIMSASLIVAWRFNQRVKFLGLAVIPLLVIGLIFLLTLVVVSDSKQLEMNVNAMAEAVVAGKVDDVFKHVSKDFRWKGIDRELMYAGVKKSIEGHKINGVRISSFRIEEVSRATKLAKTSFLVTAKADSEIMFRTEADFVLEGDEWKLKTMRFYRPVGGQDQEIDLPGLR